MSAGERLYSTPFVRVIIGAMLTMTGVSMQFHFGEFTAHLGYGVDALGRIMGVGVVGSLLLRPYAGSWIDRIGCGRCFIASAITAAAANLIFPFTQSLWMIGAARIIMTAANSTFLATVAVFAAHSAPPHRRAESLGTIGIGGFLGMMIGPAIGDAVFNRVAPPDDAFRWFFFIIAGVSLLAGAVVVNLRLATPPRSAELPSPWTLIRRYWPGRILWVSVAFAAFLMIQTTFLERFAHYRGFEDIRWFFFTYGPSAIVLRIVGRRIPERFNRRRVCVGGLVVFSIGLLLLVPVREEWHLVLPALLMGTGHAFIFPSLVDLVAEWLPIEHRGVGTSIAFGAMDVGYILGGVAFGSLIDWKGYEVTFVIVAGAVAATALCFAALHRTSPDARREPIVASRHSP